MDNVIKKCRNIVVFEDDEGLSLIIKKQLEDVGLDVTVVESYEELVEFMRQHPHSLLLLDYLLGEITGEDIIKKLNEADLYIPFVIMTGHGDEKIAVNMMRLGARDFLFKDNAFIELLPKVVIKVINQVNAEINLIEAEKALKESEARYRSITEHMLDLVCQIDRNFVYQYVSPSHKNILGYEEEELLGHSIFEFIHPDFVDIALETLREAIEKQQSSTLVLMLLRKDGKYVYIETQGNLLYNENKELIGGILSSRDITERKRYEEALKDNEEKYRHLVSTMPDVILIYRDLEILFCNEASYDVFGFSREEMIGKNITELIYVESIPFIVDNLKKRQTREKVPPYEVQAHKKNGDRIHISIRGNYIKYDHENAVMLIISDVTARKLIEESLNLRAQLLDAALDSILILDLDGGILYANNSALKNYGFKRNEFLRLNLKQITVLEEVDTLKENMQILFNNGEVIFESVHRQKNGTLVPVEIQAKLNEINNKILVLCIIRDITERKKAESTISYERELLHNLMKYLPDTIYFKDVHSRFTRINKAQSDLLGLNDPEEACGKTDFDYFPHFQALASYDAEQKMLKTGIPIIDKVEEIERFDGQQRWVTATKVPMFDANGNPTGIVGMSRDITERIQAEQLQKCLYQISESVNTVESVQMLYERLHKIIKDLMPADNFYIAMYNETTELLSFPYFVDQYDSTPDPKPLGRGLTEYVLRTGKELLVDEDIDMDLRARGEVDLIGEPTKVWLGVPMKIGNKTTGVIVVQDYENEKTYAERERKILVFVSEQIALAIEKKRTEEELIRFNHELKESKDLLEERTVELDTLNKYLSDSENMLKEINDSKDKFFSIVAHDLKSPFNGLLGFTKILLEDFDELPPEMLKGYIANIYTTAKNVYTLIENLLEWSRIQTGKMDYSPVKMDLFDEVKYTVELLNNNAKNKNITLAGNVPQGTIVCVDNHMIHSVMQNLISNALKFTREGGLVEINSRDIGEFVEVTIADNGIGIKESDLWKLFRIDVQHTTQGTAKEKGTGLGLILVKELIEKHGGKIWAESTEGVGTKFIFTLPKNIE